MQTLLRKAFGVHPGEGKRTLRFVRTAFFWAFGTSIAETLTISFFLEKAGAKLLPPIYIIIALGMMGVSCLFLYFLRITTPGKIFLKLIYLAIGIYSTATLLMFTSPGLWFWISLQIVTYIFIAAIIACFWTFLDQYHDLQEAKRIYGLYNASHFMGYVASGTLISLVIDKVGSIFLYALVPVALILAVLEIRAIIAQVSPVEDDTIDEVLAAGKKGISTIARLFYTSPFALFVVAMSLVIQLIRTCSEFSYMDSFGRIFNPILSTPEHPIDENTIPEFLGKCKAMIAFGNIIFGMFFYRRCVRRVGLGNLLLLPPLIFVSLYSQWLIQETLWITVLAVVAVEGVLFTLEDNNFNLLVNAAPSKLRGALRIINDSFFEPIGMLFSSIFLLFMHGQSRWFGLGLSLLFLAVSAYLRILYPRSILLNLRQNAIHFERKLKEWLLKLNKKEQKECKADLFTALASPSEETKLYAFEALFASEDTTIIPKLSEAADSLSEQGKISFLKLLDQSLFSSDSRFLEKVHNWTESSEKELSKWANFYLAKRGFLHPDKVIQDLDSTDLFLRSTAIFTLKKSLSPSAALNRTIAAKEIDLLLRSPSEEEICMGLEILKEVRGSESTEKVLPFLWHDSLTVKRTAAKALAKLSDKTLYRHAFSILEELQGCSDNSFRLSCLEALGKIGDSSTVRDILLASVFFRPNERRLTETIIIRMGLKTVPSLISTVRDTKLHDRCRILAGKILGVLALPQLRANLSDIIFIEIERAYFCFFFGHTIQKRYPLYDLSLLTHTLLSGYQSVIDFIIYLLGAAGSIEDCDLLVHTLHGKNAKAHADVIETLEKNCDTEIFDKIRPLIDDLPWESKVDAYVQWKGKYPSMSLTDLLNNLENSSSLFDKTVAVHLKAKLQIPNWQQSLREQIKTGDGLFHQFAYELLEP